MDDLEIHFNAPQNASPAELATYLDDACGSDPDLRARVEALFAAGEESQGFMAEAPLSEFSADDDVGEVIDNYKLLQKIGEGGFGAVYMAEQSKPVKRRVALKIIKLGMDTKQVIARFEIERQALAMMDHPNIAKVYDAGATDLGRPFFVMELVRGIPITKFCEEQKLGTRERLELFVEVCSAVQHAHQKGIIHRDLKPSNVMVTLHDDKAVPKVIDFGVAKATQQDLTDKTLFTRFEQFIGTPAYMSPEQAQMSGLDIDTRSDIYSLGALLYELLTGTTPFDARELARAGDREIRRLISEEEPPRPSTRLTQLQGRENQEDLNLPKVTVARDLDWIVMKAMEKDRTRRYDTAKGLGMDLQRFLEDEPIEAAPPGAWYRFQKYTRRYRGALGTAAIVALALIVGTVVSVWQAIEADSQRDKSQVAELREREAKDEARRLERQSRHLAFEELLAAGKQRLGIARLAQLVRDDKDNRIAAARLLSALQFREFPTSIQRGPIAYFPNLSPDRNLVITTTEDEQGFQVWNVLTGEKVGKVLRSSMERKARSTLRGGAFHPSQAKVATYENNDRKDDGFAQLWDYESGQPVGEPIQFPKTVDSVQFTPDGRFLVTTGRNGEISLTDVDDGSHRRLLPEIFKGNGNIVSVAISPDSRMMALSRFRKVSVVDLTTRELIAEPFSNGKIHWSVCFRPDSKVVARAGDDGKVRFWSTETRELLPTVLIDDDAIDEIEYSPDGRLLSTASRSGVAKVWDVESGEVIMETVKYQSFVHKAKFDPTGRFLVTFVDDLLQVWDIGTGKPVGAPGQSPMTIVQADFGPGGDSVFFCGPGGASRLNTIKPASPNAMKFYHPIERTWSKEGDLVGRADMSPDGRWVATGGNDGTVRVWDRVTGVPVVKPLDFASGQILWVEFSPDGKLLLATCQTSQGVGVWDTTTWKRKPHIKAGSCFYATFAPFKDAEGRWRIINAGASRPQIWDAETGEKIGDPLGEIQRITRTMVDAVQWSSDGKWVLTLTNGNEALLWDAETTRLIRRFDGELGQVGHLDYLRSVSFSPDDSRLLTCGNDQTAILWETATGRQIGRKMVHGDDITYAAFSPDGTLVVTVSRDTTARLWNAETGEPVGIPLQHGSWVAHASFDPDSKRVVTASDDGTARVWDCATGLPLSESLDHGGQVYYASFSADGRQVLTAGRGGAAKLWDIPALPEGNVPEWLGEWAETIVGLRFESSGATSEVDWEEPGEIEKRVRKQAAGDEFYNRFVDWFYADPLSRPIGPNFELTLEGYVENRMREKDAEGKKDLLSQEEVLRVKPRHVSAYVAMAKRLHDEKRGDEDANLRRASYFANLAKAARPNDPVIVDLANSIELERERREIEPRWAEAEDRMLQSVWKGDRQAARDLFLPLLTERMTFASREKSWMDPKRSWIIRNWLQIEKPDAPLRVFLEKGSEWSFLDTVDDSPPEAWNQPSFDDSSWKTGAAPLGFNDDETTLLESGKEMGDKYSDGRMSFYFRKKLSVAQQELENLEPETQFLLRLVRDDGAVVYLNGKEVVRSNMPGGEIGHDTKANSVVSGDDETFFFEYKLPLEALQAGENLIAIEVHQAKPQSSDVSFDLELILGKSSTKDLSEALHEMGEQEDGFLFASPNKISLSDLTFDQLLRRAKVQMQLDAPAAAMQCYEEALARRENSSHSRDIRIRKEVQRKMARILRGEGRIEEAERLDDEITKVPPRDPEMSPKMLDLTEIYQRGWFNKTEPGPSSEHKAMETLAETLEPRDGPTFDVRGIIQLNSGVYPDAKADSEPKDYNARNNKDRPMKVSIPVGQSCRKIHFLHSCKSSQAQAGDQIASYVIHFDDGSREVCKVIYGVDLVGHWIHDRPIEEMRGIKHLTWKQEVKAPWGSNGTLGLTRQTEELPATASDKTITHIDFVSAGAKAAPFLVAVTLE